MQNFLRRRDLEIDSVLDEVGLTKDEFLALQPKHYTELTPEQLEKMRQVRDAVGPIGDDTVLQKVIDQDKLALYLSGQLTDVGGCIAKMDDVSAITTSGDMYNSLRIHRFLLTNHTL